MIRRLFVSSLLGLLIVGITHTVQAQDVAGELVFEDPLEEGTDITGWYIAGGGSAIDYGLVGDGPDGGLAWVLEIVDPGDGLNDIQPSITFPIPEDAWVYPWRLIFDIKVDIAPFFLRPIIAMNADPWSGTAVEYEIPADQEGEWTTVDVVLDAGEFLTTDNLIFIIHMGANEAYEVMLDNIQVYLLNEETAVESWMMH